jgi:RNA polymerase sigma-32 factor
MVNCENGYDRGIKKLFFNLKKIKGELRAIDDGDLLLEHVTVIAERLNVSLREGGFNEWQDVLVDETESQETTLAATEELKLRRGLLTRAIGLLSGRECHIITERGLFDKPLTLQQLSRVYEISRERGLQIEANALKKIKVSIGEETNRTDLAV